MDPTSRLRRCLIGLYLALALLVAGCASVPFDQPKSVSEALADTGETPLGQAVAEIAPETPGLSGFYLLADGVEAFAARFALLRQAERSLDIQYYFILDSLTARIFLGEVLAAADRGVRVRFLLDDISTGGYERWMAAFESHPGIEIRLFNPFSRRGASRVFDFATRLGTVGHRMHNKSFTADNQVTVVGGRNIADEYFAARSDLDFLDFDLLGVGPVVSETSAAFDLFWNSRAAVPVSALVEPELDRPSLDEIRQWHLDNLEEARATAYGKALESKLLERIQGDESSLVWAESAVVHDLPEKAERSDLDPATELLASHLAQAMDEADEEFFLISPYFVPLKSGVRRLEELRERGVRVVILTNSLAATDVWAVHAGYKKYRKALLRAGVELWELRADLGETAAPVAHEQTSLHAKSFVVDRRALFVGSFNWDPRSVTYNTEMGIMVQSRALAAGVADRVQARLPESAYRLQLDAHKAIEWIGLENGIEIVLSKEPQASFWRRFAAGFLGIFPIQWQL